MTSTAPVSAKKNCAAMHCATKPGALGCRTKPWRTLPLNVKTAAMASPWHGASRSLAARAAFPASRWQKNEEHGDDIAG